MNIIIIGGGQAAASIAHKFRSHNQNAHVTIISEEAHPPYQRPPLSKKYLAGDMELERLYLRPMSWYEEQNVELRLNSKVTKLDRGQKTITLENGDVLPYDKLAFATGSRARELPTELTQGASNAYTVRGIQDIDTMLPEFQKGKKLVVIGGGYIGLEAASIARKFEMDVTVIEAAPRILGRVASEETASLIRDLHEASGVRIMEDTKIAEYVIENNRITAVKLENGDDFSVDAMIVGIGILPNIEVAEDAGILCDQGILVNEFGQTNDPDIYAAGDCTRFEYKDALVRIESVGNAIDQGEVVGANLAGVETRYAPKPWFWSDQFDVTLQIAGWNAGFNDVVTRKTEDGASSVWYYQGEQLIAVDALSDPRAYMIAKRVIEGGKNIPKTAAADPEADLKTYMK